MVTRWFLKIAPLLLTSMLAAGCSSLPFFGGGASPAMVSPLTGDTFRPDLSTRVFAPSSAGIADFYLTDLPSETLAGGGDLTDVSATIVHVHLFAVPKAGRTPISNGATNAVVRVYMLSQGQVGMYGGGGFFRESGEAASQKFGATTSGATLSLTRATRAFDDAIGPNRLSGHFSARRDEETCRAVRAVVRVLEGVMENVTGSGDADR
jgi:hypothetical protein